MDAAQVEAVQAALKAEGAKGDVIGPHLGALGGGVEAMKTFANTASVLFDAVFVPGGAPSVATLRQQGDAALFIDEAFKHGKPLAASGEGVGLVEATQTGRLLAADDVHARRRTGRLPEPSAAGLLKDFVAALAHHRFFNRKQAAQISA